MVLNPSSDPGQEMYGLRRKTVYCAVPTSIPGKLLLRSNGIIQQHATKLSVCSDACGVQ
jgi:hypothetical protein